MKNLKKLEVKKLTRNDLKEIKGSVKAPWVEDGCPCHCAPISLGDARLLAPAQNTFNKRSGRKKFWPLLFSYIFSGFVEIYQFY